MSNNIIEEVLIIKEGECYFGITTDVVEQILRVQELTPMALTPKAIRGLCSIEGSIICALDFAYLIDNTQATVDETKFKARQITIKSGKHKFSLLVSEVINSVKVETDNIEYIQDNEDCIAALLKHDDEIVQIVDIERLIKDISLPSYTKNKVQNIGIENIDNSETSHMKRYLFFIMKDESYALEVDSIREIIALPESFTEVAKSSDEILGMISLRDELLLVADLRTYYDLHSELSEKNSIIVSQHLGRHIGLAVDEILDIKDIDIKAVDKLPENFKDNKIDGVLHMDDSLISIISPETIRTLVNKHNHLIGDAEQSNNLKETQADDKINLEVVVFSIADEEYAFNITSVSEIIDMTQITPIAESNEHIRGMINIRGQIISVASLYDILKLDEKDDIEQKIVVTKIKENYLGFIVDKINDVMDIKDDEIKLDSNTENQLFSNILQLDGGERLVMLFDTDALLTSLKLNEDVA